jgi:hypothetical protein
MSAKYAFSRDTATHFRNERYSYFKKTINIWKYSKGNFAEFKTNNDGGKNNSVWFKKTCRRKIFLFSQTYLLSWGITSYAGETEELVCGCNKYNNLDSLSHF